MYDHVIYLFCAYAELKKLKEAPVEVAVMEVDQKALDKARADAIAEMQTKLDKANQARTKAEEKCKAAEKALEEARAQLAEHAREDKRAKIAADKDMATFEILFRQSQETANQMQGILLKVRRREDQQAAEIVAKSMTALGDAIRRAAE